MMAALGRAPTSEQGDRANRPSAPPWPRGLLHFVTLTGAGVSRSVRVGYA